MRTAVVDLFCGVGGLTCGLRKAGLKVIAGLDFDSTCKYAYEKNNHAKFINADVAKYPSKDIASLYKNSDIKVLVGCAPCQTFSTQANKYRKNINKETDVRWNLLRAFANHIQSINPEIVSMENVPSLQHFEVFSDFKEALENYYNQEKGRTYVVKSTGKEYTISAGTISKFKSKFDKIPLRVIYQIKTPYEELIESIQ